MQLKCDQCGAPFQADDLHFDRGIAVCSACGGVWRMPDRPDRDNEVSDRQTKPKNVPVSERFTVEDDGQQLRIRYRWFHPAIFFLLFFAIAWDSFLIFWYSMAFGADGPPGAFRWIMILFPICHVAVGVGLTYFVVACFLNTTTIQIGGGMLSIRHGPVPWRGNLDLLADDIQQVFCKQNVRRGRDDDGCDRASTTHEVWAVAGERQVRLLSTVMDADQALFVEQEIEKFLRIPDRPVAGEMRA